MPTPSSTKARRAAWLRLAEAHPDEFAAILAEERLVRGLPVTAGRRGRPSVERVPAPAWLAKIGPRYVAPELGISAAVWRTWVRLGVPVGREADVAAAVSVPIEVLWPELEPQPAEEPKAKRARSVPEPAPFGCDRCPESFRTRADLARDRLHTGHGHDEDVA